MENKLIVTKQEDKVISAVFEGKEMVQVNIHQESEEGLLGNIYLGKVKNIVKNINAAFVEISGGRMCYLSLNEEQYPLFSKPKKSEKIVIGDEFLVQISKEDVKTKAPVVTTKLNITGKYAVLIHGKTTLGISSKIGNETRKKELKEYMKEFRQEGYGFIIRTNGALVPLERIGEEIYQLIRQYEKLKEYGVHKTPFSLVYSTPPGYLCDIRDGLAESLGEIITDDAGIYQKIHEYMTNYQKEDLSKLRFYEDKLLSLGNLYSVKTKLENALKSKVWLKSGGTVIIQPTEALTVIDVNTGKAVSGKKKAIDTFFKINMEAAVEIARQIRLRNLSGIIIIDFIDMELSEYKDQLMKRLEELFKLDPIKTTLVDMTALNLVEITRKKVRKPLLEQMGINVGTVV
ncbi:ribonuclease G [Anaerocolumna cellulosilytica]|uniref:Ribonuclease G n=1 Tax=Anaerocolumna cellulosilytica TaxID=433286 RepID=A0A6S6R6T7_9FIRM|nr:ribonuclease E/G [Anaerocolumna cellulosilytica]MBB5193788.1 ribonuclease G [Anaerocolumna cellulosilytica]BCJ94995.1 ribonuclease G [Anaerocolumna cellulosilytica]